MRVLHVGKFFPPFAGGMENFLGDLLPALAKQGVESTALVHCSSEKPVPGDSCFDESKVIRVPCYGSVLYAPISPGFPVALNRAIKQAKPDILHLHVPNTSAFWAMLLPKAYPIPWVIHWHADVVSSRIDRRLAAAYTVYRPVEQKMLARAAAVITTSQRYGDSSLSLQNWREKIRVIPLGLNPDRLPVPGPVEAEQAGVVWGDRDQLRVLSIGRLTYYKGHEVLIRAAAEMRNIRVVIAGEGDKRRDLEKLIEKLKIQDRVLLCGRLSETRLQALLAGSDCFCLPSVERTEAFGLVLLEAMRYGKPVIVGDIPGSGVGWVVRNGSTGCLFPVSSTPELVRLLRRYSAHPEERRAMGEAGRQRFESIFHIDRIAEKTLQLYNNVLSVGCPGS